MNVNWHGDVYPLGWRGGEIGIVFKSDLIIEPIFDAYPLEGIVTGWADDVVGVDGEDGLDEEGEVVEVFICLWGGLVAGSHSFFKFICSLI